MWIRIIESECYPESKIDTIFMPPLMSGYQEMHRKNSFSISAAQKLASLILILVLSCILIPSHLYSQFEDSLTGTFYKYLYSYNFESAEATLEKIHGQYNNDMIFEMVSINYGYWMLFTGRNTPGENKELIARIGSDIARIEKTPLDQEMRLQLILLYSFQSRIHNKLDNKLSAIQSFRTSYAYFKQLSPCSNSECEIQNLVSGMYYVLTGYIRKDFPLLFRIAFEKEFADVNKGLSMLSKGIHSNTLQIEIESRYFLMKLHAEVNEDADNALIYADQLVDLFPENLTYRIYQLGLFHQLDRNEDIKKAYPVFIRKLYGNQQLTPNQRKVLLAECNESIGM